MQIYMRSQDPQAKSVDVPKMTSTEDYYSFISENITQKILETEPFAISSYNIEPTILDARPLQNIYTGMPEKG